MRYEIKQFSLSLLIGRSNENERIKKRFLLSLFFDNVASSRNERLTFLSNFAR